MIYLRRILKLGFTNFWRNRWLSLAASLMIMLTLFTMSVFALLNVLIDATTDGIKDRIDLSVFFYENATDQQIQDIQYQLLARPDVKKVQYVDKDQALRLWQQRVINPKIKDIITKDANPLPRSIQVKANTPESLGSIAHYLSGEQYKPIVREVSYQKTKAAIDTLLRLTKIVRRIGLLLTGFLLLVSLIVILNTIRLTVFTRRDEVEIMRLVGANGSFIRIPFSIEAILYGLVGGMLAFFALAIFMSIFGVRAAGYFADIATVASAPHYELLRPYFAASIAGEAVSLGRSILTLWQIGILQVAIGVIFSVGCSLIALRRYLRF